jgi:hypothetical protein
MSLLDRLFPRGLMLMLRSHKGEIVTDTVERLTGHPPRTFEAWCRDHVNDFR